jgi:hypothetical protein
MAPSNRFASSQSFSSSPHQVLVNGMMLNGTELRDYATHKGLCKICATQKTHRRMGHMFRRSWAPLTVKDAAGDNYSVYKGYCLQPTCYTLNVAQERLGEKVTRPRRHRRSSLTTVGPNGKKKKKKRRRTRTEGEQRSNASSHRTLGVELPSSDLVSSGTVSSSDQASSSDLATSSIMLSPSLFDSAFHEDSTHHEEEIIFETTTSLLDESETDLSTSAILISSTNTADPPHDDPPATTATVLLEQLQDAAQQDDVSTILHILEHAGPNEFAVAHAGLVHLQTCMIAQQHDTPTTVLSSDTTNKDDRWATVIWSCILERFQKNHRVVLQGLATLFAIGAGSPVYAQQACHRSDHCTLLLELAVEHETDRDLQHAVCVLMACLTQYNSCSSDGALVRYLVARFTDMDDPALIRASAAQSLLHLAMMDDNRHDDSVQQALSTEVLWEFLASNDDESSLTDSHVHAVLSLLCLLVGRQPPKDSTNLAVLSAILSRPASAHTHMAALALVLSLAEESSSSLDASTTPAQDCVLAICQCMLYSKEVYPLALCALRETIARTQDDFTAEECSVIVTTIVSGMEDEQSLGPDITAVGVELLALVLEWNNETSSSSSRIGAILMRAFRQFSRSGSCRAAKLSTARALEQWVGGFCSEDENKKIFVQVLRAAENENDEGIWKVLLRIAHYFPQMSQGASVMPIWAALLDRALQASLESPDIIEQIVRELECQWPRHVEFNGTLDQLHQVTLFTTDGESETSIIYSSLELLEIVLRAMENYRAHAAVQKACCVALSRLAEAFLESRKQDTGEEDVESSLVVSKTFPLVLVALETHRDDADFEESAAHLSSVLFCCCNSYETKKEWGIRLMRQCRFEPHEDTPPTSRYLVACDAATTLLFGEAGSADDDSVVQNETIEFLVTMLRHPHLRVVLPASETLALFTQQGFEASRYLVQVEGVASTILACMQRFPGGPDSAQVQRSLLTLFVSKGALQDYRYQDEIANCGGLKAILVVLDIYSNNDLLVESACRALLVVLTRVKQELLWAGREPLTHAIIEAVRAHRENLSVLTVVTDVIRCLCTDDSDFRKVFARSIIKPLVASMDHHFANPLFLASGCTILRMVARYGSQGALRESSATEMITNAMLSHLDCSTLLEEGLMTLAKLAGNPTTRSCIDDFDKIERTVICLMRANYLNPDVLAEAFGALNNVVVDSAEKTVARLSDETVLEILVDAMKRFPDSKALLMNASLLLNSFTYEPDNFQMLHDVSSTLVPVLVEVSEKYPGDVQKLAIQIMHKL